MPGESARINGLKGGRPKGSENFDTKQRREMKNRWFQLINNEADAIFQAQLTLALGCYAEKQTPDGVQRVYKRPPDAKSLQWIMEQVWGRPSQPSDLEDVSERVTESELSRETQRAISQAVKFALPTRKS